MNPGPMNPRQIRWEGEDIPVTDGDVASAATGPAGIVLSFGRLEPGDLDGSVRGRLLHQVVLRPEAAAGLRQMLARILAAHAGAHTHDMAAGVPSSLSGGAPAAAQQNSQMKR